MLPLGTKQAVISGKLFLNVYEIWRITENILKII
jgi:hypothetical protein